MRLVLPLLAALLLPASAWACSCVEPHTNGYVGPEFDATDVPTNTRVWLGGSEGTVPGEPDQLVPFGIESEDGDLVLFTTTTLVSDWKTHVILTPDVELLPDTVYSVIRESDDAVVTRFRTGLGPDHDPPSVPQTLSVRIHAESAQPEPPSSCGATDGVSVEFESDGAIVVGDLLGRATLDVDAIDGEVAEHNDGGSRIWFTNGGCSSAWEGLELGDVAEWQLGAFDLAGNFSGWSAVETAEVSVAAAAESAQAAACADAGCDASGGSLGLLIPLVLAGRRRRA